ncbi:hypothetical protein AVEN_104264-1 [Araneus ventricosus]|uniref:Uncharacterized protein n=1 Tax=Araneus ventricosus TaxID=182803 RepID=A0A4Y2LX48_ARAVE|nr:hypothetical protein AVEN_104264-1 [Araneus ventricosus]
MLNSKEESTPVDPGMKYMTESKDNMLNTEGAFRYRQGGLLYSADGTRPDMAFATTYMSQFNNCPRGEHWCTTHTSVRYADQRDQTNLPKDMEESRNVLRFRFGRRQN